MKNLQILVNCLLENSGVKDILTCKYISHIFVMKVASNMKVSRINSTISFSQQKYKQPTLKEQFPSMASGFVLGAIPAGIYYKSKKITGKNLVFYTLEAASACAFLSNLLYLIIHKFQKEGGNHANQIINNPN